MIDFSRELTAEEQAEVQKLTETPVTVAFQTRGNDIYYRLVIYLLEQQKIFKHFNMVTAGHNRWDETTKGMFYAALQTPFEYLHIVDSDVGPRQDTLLRLMSHNLDIVAAPVWMYNPGANQIHLNYHKDRDFTSEHVPKPPEVGLERIFSTSFACVLIRRRVIEMFVQTKEEFTEWSPLIAEEHKRYPTDCIFYEKANALGFDVWMDWGAEIAVHNKTVALSSSCMETYAAHRVLGYVLGPEKAKEMLMDEDGRARCADILRDSPATYRSGSTSGTGAGPLPGETRSTASVCPDGVCQGVGAVTGTTH